MYRNSSYYSCNVIQKLLFKKKNFYTSTRTAKVKKDTKYYNLVQQPNAHIPSGGNVSWHNHFGKQFTYKSFSHGYPTNHHFSKLHTSNRNVYLCSAEDK